MANKNAHALNNKHAVKVLCRLYENPLACGGSGATKSAGDIAEVRMKLAKKKQQQPTTIIVVCRQYPRTLAQTL